MAVTSRERLEPPPAFFLAPPISNAIPRYTLVSGAASIARSNVTMEHIDWIVGEYEQCLKAVRALPGHGGAQE